MRERDRVGGMKKKIEREREREIEREKEKLAAGSRQLAEGRREQAGGRRAAGQEGGREEGIKSIRDIEMRRGH